MTKVEKNRRMKQEVNKMRSEGKTLDEIYQQIKIKYPNPPSRTGLARYLKKISPMMELHDIGLVGDDIDLVKQSKLVGMIANSLFMQMVMKWKKENEISVSEIHSVVSLLKASANMINSAIMLERGETALQKYFDSLSQIIREAVSEVAASPDLADKIIQAIKAKADEKINVA